MNLIFLIFFSILISVLYVWTVRLVQRNILWNKYKIITDLFDYFQDRAYMVIYTDQLIVYTSSGTVKLPKEELETVERNFVKLAFELMGPENKKVLESFYGTQSSIINNMIIYFRKRLENDQLAKTISSSISS